MDMTPEDFTETLATLAWQIELGADEAIAEEPINRFEMDAKAEPVVQPSTPAVSVTMVKSSDAPDYAALSAQIAANCTATEELQKAIQAFEGCELKRGARKMVFHSGNPAASLMVIGGAPNREEDLAGCPFVGIEGELLDKMLAAITLERFAQDPGQAVYLTCALPWRPLQDRPPNADELAVMKPFLLRHIELVQPEILLLAGNVATNVLLDNTDKVSKSRGRWHEVSGIPTLSIYHPAQLLRAPIRKRDAWADLLTLKSRLESL